MPYKDNLLGDIFPTRNGTAVGASQERTMLDALNDTSGFRTRIVKNADGSETMLRTKGGTPQFTTTETSSTPEEVDDFQLYHGLVETSSRLIRTDWEAPDPAVFETTTVARNGDTYYSSFPLVSPDSLSKVQTIGSYTIAPGVGGPYDVTSVRSNNKSYKEKAQGMQWPYRTPTQDVRFFKVSVTPATDHFRVVVTRDDAVVIADTNVAKAALWGSNPIDFGEYDSFPQHSPSGSVALLQFYCRNDVYAQYDPRFEWTDLLLVGVLRVTIVSHLSATISVEKTYTQCVVEESTTTPTSKSYDSSKPSPYYVERTIADKSHWTYYGELGKVGDYSGVIYWKTSSLVDVSVTYRYVPNSPQNGSTTVENKTYLLSMFFADNETPNELKVTNHANNVSSATVSATGNLTYSRHELDERSAEYGHDLVITTANYHTGTGTAEVIVKSEVHNTSSFDVTCGATSLHFSGPSFDSVVGGKYSLNADPSYAAPAMAPFTLADRYYNSAYDYGYTHNTSTTTVESTANGIVSTTSLDEGPTVVRPDKIVYVSRMTNNVFRIVMGNYDDPKNQALQHSVIVSSGETATTSTGQPHRYKASWNPRYKNLEIADDKIQWI